MTIQDFVKANKIRMYIKHADSNPNMDNSCMNHYKVTLVSDGKQMTLPFSMGIGIKRKPLVEDVIDCIISDASYVENCKDFEDFCYQFGYDGESQKTKRIYDACVKQTEKFKKLIGSAYEAALECERL